MPNPAMKVSTSLAAIAAGVLANNLLRIGWKAAFHEDPPTKKAMKSRNKDLDRQRKEAQKTGARRNAVERLENQQAEVETPIWKIIVWTVISGIVVAALRNAAERGVNHAFTRRPRANRG